MGPLEYICDLPLAELLLYGAWLETELLRETSVLDEHSGLGYSYWLFVFHGFELLEYFSTTDPSQDKWWENKQNC